MEPAIDGGLVAVAQGIEEDFENVLDVPFITMNRVDGQYIAEVVIDLDDEVTEARVQQALNVGYQYGVHSYARKHGDYNVILIHFTADTEAVAA